MPYKQRVVGSNPTSPTPKAFRRQTEGFFYGVLRSLLQQESHKKSQLVRSTKAFGVKPPPHTDHSVIQEKFEFEFESECVGYAEKMVRRYSFSHTH